MKEATARVLAELVSERGRFLAFLERRVGGDAEDVLQVALLRAVKHADTVEGPAAPWFFGILRNAVSDHVRRVQTRAKIDLDRPDAEPASDTPLDVCCCSVALLRTMRPEYAEIVRRIDLNEEPLADAAAALEITVNNASVRLHRARGALKKALFEACGTASLREAFGCACGC